jgi:DNA-binding NtrC family response regulator
MCDTDPSEQKHVILIVEDEEVIRELLREHLSDLGFEVISASNADEARKIIASREAIELVLTDVNMPGSMDGAELAKWLDSYAPSMPVILVSGKASFPSNASAKRLFLRKPFQLSDLEDRIRKLLD